MNVYRYCTRAGTFLLIPSQRGWMAWFGDDCFDGPFRTAKAAAEDIANGHSAWPSCGDPSALGIPEDIGEWERCIGR